MVQFNKTIILNVRQHSGSANEKKFTRCQHQILILSKRCGLVVKGEDWQLSGCGFKPRRRILDSVSEASYYIGKREIKVAKWSTPKKIFKKKSFHPKKLFMLKLLLLTFLRRLLGCSTRFCSTIQNWLCSTTGMFRFWGKKSMVRLG